MEPPAGSETWSGFVVGANLPWINYGTDFGASAWYPEGGLGSRQAALAPLHDALAALRRDGMSILRVFMLCDGRSGIRYGDGGMPLGLDDAFYRDVDAMLDAVRAHDLRVMLVLFDFHLCGPALVVNDVQLGGRSGLIVQPHARAALIDRVLTPIVERYSNEATIAAWDLMNEPEWCVGRLRALRRSRVPLAALQAFLEKAVECVRGSTRQPVTVGCAGTWQLDLVRPLGLDFYQVHWYERFGWAALQRPVAELGLDRPVILGEFSGVRTRWGAIDVLDAARRAGYQGALVWSVLSDDDQSGYPTEIVEWARANASGRGRSANT